MRILYDSSAVHSAIKKVLTRTDKAENRRVVVVAYVGDAAEAFLPHPEGMDIICNLQPGSTSALALERLKKRGAQLFHSPRLHMKVYWSSAKGCVMTSANASGSALSRGGLQEAGIFLEPGQVDVDQLIKSIAPKPVKKADLLDLQRKADALDAKGISRAGGGHSESVEFDEWLASFARKPWKLGWWTEYGAMSAAAEAEAKRTYGVSSANDYLSCQGRQYKAGDWILAFELGKKKLRPYWRYVDFVVKVDPDDRAYSADYPLQAVQVHQAKRYPSPPFEVHSTRFRAALTTAVKEYGENWLDELRSLLPPKRFVDLLAVHWANARNS